jgi:hypothetical protein
LFNYDDEIKELLDVTGISQAIPAFADSKSLCAAAAEKR